MAKRTFDKMGRTDQFKPWNNRGWKHGTTNGYKKHGCKCDLCMEAMRKVWAQRSRPTVASTHDDVIDDLLEVLYG